MGVRSRLASDFAVVVRDFGESVTYTSKDGGDPLTFDAVVTRAEPDARPEARMVGAATMRLLVRNSSDPTLGLASIEEGDVFAFPLRHGDATDTECRVLAVASQNPGFWRVEVAP